ncbi:Zinc finger protein CKR1 [Melipona quadrifasciata]|uniref:Zinc finger protein CKR1 n=1 Tax=Melipona quadrifasciata TaxID=166423 RepID=A0A0N0BGK8_9HYME|nr:Zinc finger protein CKR1 [Melipona quadrifasciata]
MSSSPEDNGFYAAAPQLDLNFVLQSCKAFENEGSNREVGQTDPSGASVPRSLPNYARVKNTYAKGSFADCFRKPFGCPKCGRCFTVKGNMTRHLKYECGQAPRFQCPYCEFRSKQTSNVMSHIRTRHTDIKKIKIETDLENLCSVVMEEAKDFDYEEEKPLGSRRRRAAAIRDIERHTCSRCSKSYIHAWHLKRHTKFECGQEPRVQCPYCAARMKQRGHVYRHIRQCHRGQNVSLISSIWLRTFVHDDCSLSKQHIPDTPIVRLPSMIMFELSCYNNVMSKRSKKDIAFCDTSSDMMMIFTLNQVTVMKIRMFM